MFKLDQNIALPPTPYGNKGRETFYPWAQMQIGDSFFVPQGDRKSKFSAHGASKRYNAKYATRAVIEDDIKGERVWRVE